LCRTTDWSVEVEAKIVSKYPTSHETTLRAKNFLTKLALLPCLIITVCWFFVKTHFLVSTLLYAYCRKKIHLKIRIVMIGRLTLKFTWSISCIFIGF
jgi:hypothetical protein